jgi:hypothetical protein
MDAKEKFATIPPAARLLLASSEPTTPNPPNRANQNMKDQSAILQE